MFCNELYLIKVNNVKQIVVLDKNNKIKAGVAKAFSKENKTTIIKIIVRHAHILLLYGTGVPTAVNDGLFGSMGEQIPSYRLLQ